MVIAAVPLTVARLLGALPGSGDDATFGAVLQPFFLIALLTASEWVDVRRQMRSALETVGAMDIRGAGLAGVRQTLPVSAIAMLYAVFMAAVGGWDLGAIAIGLALACVLRTVASDLVIRWWERRDAQRYLLRAELGDDNTLLCEPL